MHYQPSKSLQEHLKQEHHQGTFAEYLKEIIYGGIDGIVTTFAVVAGFSGAAMNSDTTLQLSFSAVLLFGLANLFADGLSMGLGNFLSVRSENDLYYQAQSKEQHEIEHNPDSEAEETKEILMQKGYNDQDSDTLIALYKKNPTYWVEWMMHHELEMSNPDSTNPVLTGLATFLSFLVFGSIPLLPYIFGTYSTEDTFFIACAFTLLALVLLGILKWRVIKQNLVRSLIEVVIVGSTAAIVAYYVGVLFKM